VEERSFEAYAPRYAGWAKTAGRPTAPERFSPRCPGRASLGSIAEDRDEPKIRFPRDGARFVVDSNGPARQEIVLAAVPSKDQRAVRFVLDGRPLATVGAPFELAWMLSPGTHRLDVETSRGERAEPVTFDVARAQ
jgi:hypothetical protein